MKKLVLANRKFWDGFQEKEADNLLLVEVNSNPVINHSNAVTAKMVAQAKMLKIAWFGAKQKDKLLMKSYSKNSVFVEVPTLTLLRKLNFFLISVRDYFLQFRLRNDFLHYQHNGVEYGDFIYDCYLASCSQATFHRNDLRVILVIYRLMIQDWMARKCLSNKMIKALLVSHYIGMNTGPMSRVAMQARVPVYWKGGGHEVFNLSVFRNLEDRYEFPKKPSSKIINELVGKKWIKVERDFKKYVDQKDKPYYGVFAAIQRVKKQSDSQRLKKRFIQKHRLDNKPIMLVMLHAFNDHPHSHFRKMVFGDYYDWFMETLVFARKDKTKNWIFKEHPVNPMYPTVDLDLHQVMSHTNKNLVFVPFDSNLSTSEVLTVADCVITCLGSGGIEAAAYNSTRVITAGDSAYSGLGFTMDAKNKRDYFEMLRNFKPSKLTEKKRRLAAATYMYLTKYCMMPFTAGPGVTFEESRQPRFLKRSYGKKVLDVYKKKKRKIQSEMKQYSSMIGGNNFTRLERLP